jgi:hypothetical protein
MPTLARGVPVAGAAAPARPSQPPQPLQDAAYTTASRPRDRHHALMKSRG